MKICSKFKITETQNENSQSLYSWKIPKFGQILGKLGSGSGLKYQNCGELRARAKFRKYMLKYTWKIYRATLDRGESNPPPTWPTVLQLLSRTLTGKKKNFPQKNIIFLRKSKNVFPKIVVKFRPPSRGLKKHKLSLYSYRLLNLYSPIFPKK